MEERAERHHDGRDAKEGDAEPVDEADEDGRSRAGEHAKGDDEAGLLRMVTDRAAITLAVTVL
jgi:hypothetical protein